MQAFVDALALVITPATLWGAIVPLAGLIGVVVVFSIAVHFLRRLIGGVGKAKPKI